MFLAEILFAIGIALVLTAIFSAAFGSTGPWPSFWVFFGIVLLVAWAAGLWARPFGPALWGVYWLPFVVFGLIAALVIAAATPPSPDVPPDVPDRPLPANDVAATEASIAISVFVWILVAILLIAIVAGYVW